MNLFLYEPISNELDDRKDKKLQLEFHFDDQTNRKTNCMLKFILNTKWPNQHRFLRSIIVKMTFQPSQNTAHIFSHVNCCNKCRSEALLWHNQHWSDWNFLTQSPILDQSCWAQPHTYACRNMSTNEVWNVSFTYAIV